MSNPTKFTSLTFDASKVAPAVPLEAFPAGNYTVAMTDGEIKPTSDGSGKRLAFELTVLEGPFKGRKVWDGLNIENKSQVAQEIAHQQLSAICHAVGSIRIQSVQELFNKPFEAKIGFDDARVVGDKTYDPRNTFKGAKPVAGGSPAVSGASAGGATNPPWAGKPAAAPAAAPAAPAAAPTPAPKKPGPKAKPPAPAPVVKDERKFFVYFDDANMPLHTAEEVGKLMLAGKIEPDTMLQQEGTEEWKAASTFAIPVAAPAAAPAPAVAAPAGPKPPWAK